jgi:hypothetical protein
LEQVRAAIADEHEVMAWSAWPSATGYTCAVDGDGRSLGSAIVFRDHSGTEQGRQRLTLVEPDRVEYRLRNRGPLGRTMTPEVDFRLDALDASCTRVLLDFRASAPLPPGARHLVEPFRPTTPTPARAPTGGCGLARCRSGRSGRSPPR